MITIDINGVEVTMPATAKLNMLRDHFNCELGEYGYSLEIDARGLGQLLRDCEDSIQPQVYSFADRSATTTNATVGFSGGVAQYEPEYLRAIGGLAA
jgi:hypothetical protein